MGVGEGVAIAIIASILIVTIMQLTLWFLDKKRWKK